MRGKRCRLIDIGTAVEVSAGRARISRAYCAPHPLPHTHRRNVFAAARWFAVLKEVISLRRLHILVRARTVFIIFGVVILKGVVSEFERVRARSTPAARQLAAEAPGELSHQD